MAKTFEAPLRFAEGAMDIFVYREGNSVRMVNFYENQKLDCGNATDESIRTLVRCLEEVVNHPTMKYFDKIDEIMLGMKTFMQLNTGCCLLGDLKPGAIYDDPELDDFERDPWKDGPSWHVWISAEYIAKEYYSRQEQKRQRGKK